ncbi:MAG: hypothetical protein PHC90_09870 [Syntrophorhabdaceae bacterium]|nr:hypothetical protein [Syntrophorhabdaceae bacterium]
MKAALFYPVILACLLLVPIASDNASAQTSIQQKMKRFNCAKDRSGVMFCRRVAPSGRFAGQEGVYTEKSGGKVCKWKCRTEQGIETCQASGSECTGKTPPHWR